MYTFPYNSHMDDVSNFRRIRLEIRSYIRIVINERVNAELLYPRLLVTLSFPKTRFGFKKKRSVPTFAKFDFEKKTLANFLKVTA